MEVYLGSLMLVPYNFAPSGYALCEGQLLSISSASALFSLLGTRYGGNGTTNFGLPDLRGRLAISYGQGPGLSSYDQGQVGGTPVVNLTPDQQPAHTHTMSGAKGGGSQVSPASASLAQVPIYSDQNTPLSILNPNSLSTMPGGGQPHGNMMPYQGLNWIICVSGPYPPRS